MIVLQSIVERFDLTSSRRTVMARFANDAGHFVEVELSEESLSSLLRLHMAAQNHEAEDESEYPEHDPLPVQTAPVRIPAQSMGASVGPPARGAPAARSGEDSPLVLSGGESIFESDEGDDGAYLYGDDEAL